MISITWTDPASKPVLEVSTDGMLGAHGWGDGEPPEEIAAWFAATIPMRKEWFNYHFSWTEFLEMVARDHVIPALERSGYTVQLYIYDGIHNNVRADVVTRHGVPLEWGGELGYPELFPTTVTIPWEVVEEFVKEYVPLEPLGPRFRS